MNFVCKELLGLDHYQQLSACETVSLRPSNSMVKAAGSLGERNAVHCGSIEKKMGIKGYATCVMNFDGATGYLLGEENRGLEVMFGIMNVARLGTALQACARVKHPSRAHWPAPGSARKCTR
jgi:hypothetical protein